MGKPPVCVRAEASSRRANSPGAITNYLESGHIVRGATSVHLPVRSANMSARSVRARVRGFGFYAASQPSVKEIEAEVASKAAAEVAAKIARG